MSNDEKELPVIPPLTEEEKRRRNNPDPNPDVAKCGECGIVLKRVMGYVCRNINCPIQPKVT